MPSEAAPKWPWVNDHCGNPQTSVEAKLGQPKKSKNRVCSFFNM